MISNGSHIHEEIGVTMSERPITRRQFIQGAGALVGAALVGGAVSARSHASTSVEPSPVQIAEAVLNFEREMLANPYGFKGGFMTNVWQTVVRLQGASGGSTVGLSTQNVLWSDAQVFTDHSDSGGNALMLALTERALQLTRGTSFDTPIDLLDQLLDPVYRYGQQITGEPNLRENFALNALVPVDNAAWLLYAAENGLGSFDEMIPPQYRSGLSYRHDRVASAPAFGYASSIDEVEQAARDGYYVMKIKLGHPGTQEEMLEQDMERLTAIHEAIGHLTTEHTEDGRLPYYLDFNGRYESKDRIRRFLDHARTIGAFEQIIIMEDPFPEEIRVSVDDLGVNVTADESVHRPHNVAERMQMGYQSVALKPIAKTLSMTVAIAQAAYEQDVPCFCADLTVNPVLLDWNKNVAARLQPLPGLDTGLMEANGWQTYANWRAMESYHPCTDASWRQVRDGVYQLNEQFYERSGCIFEPPDHYARLVELS